LGQPVSGRVCVGSYQTNVVNEMLATVVNIQPKDSGGSGGETRESIVYQLADDMLNKLPVDYVQHEVSSSSSSLWPPCVADADIIFLPCGFFYLSSFFFFLA